MLQLLIFIVLAIASPASKPASKPASPVVIETIERELPAGVVRGVLARVDLTDPRVTVGVWQSDETDPDGDGPMTTTLQTVRHTAAGNDLELAVNASFFRVAASKQIAGRTVRYFPGNPATPVGWLVDGGKIVSRAAGAQRGAIYVERDGTVAIGAMAEPGTEVVEAVSGGNVLIANGEIVIGDSNERHPRTAVAIAGETLLLLVIDGRREGHSVGMTERELAELLKALGASDAVNMDGGGSSTVVAEDPAGTFVVQNKPSDGSELPLPLSIERAVADVIGIDIAE